MSSQETEILVHITAPCRAQDDVLYRRLARAYLDFQPAARRTRHDIFSSDSSSDAEEREPARAVSSQAPLVSPDLSFRSVLDNAGSPPPLPPAQAPNPPSQPQHRSISQLSFVPPPSVIEDSQPDNSAGIKRFCSPTRIFEHQLRALCSSPTRTAPGPRAQSTEEALAADITSSAPVVIPSSPPRPVAREAETPSAPDGHCAGRIRDSSELDRVSSSAQAEIERPSSPSSPGREMSPAPLPGHALTRSASDIGAGRCVKRRRISLPPGRVLPRSSSDIGPRRDRSDSLARHQPRETSPPFASAPLDPDLLEVWGPEPAVSERDLGPDDLLTPKLVNLAHQLEIGRRFGQKRQLLQGREPRPFERGFWTLDCRGWEAEHRQRVWAFLANYVRQGGAGWSVWVKRDAETNWIRLYSCGHVLGHMYLALYVASRRRILYTDCTWSSAVGDMVVVRASRIADSR